MRLIKKNLIVVICACGFIAFVMVACAQVVPSGKSNGEKPRPKGVEELYTESGGSFQKSSWLDRARAMSIPGRRSFALPLNNPSTVSVSEATHMKPDDIVVGVNFHGHSRAYPWWILANYHIVNDTINFLPLYVALCEICSAASAFYPIIDELPRRPLTFQIYRKAAGTFNVLDIQTLSVWHPFSGIATDGPLKGRKLEKVPSVLTTWEQWTKQEPDTEVLLASEKLRYNEHNAGRVGIAAPDRMRYQVIDDDRLPTNAMVYGLIGKDAQTGLAFSLDKLKEQPFYELDFDQRPILVFSDGDYRALAFYRLRGDEVLNFKRVEDDAPQFIDQFGTVWNQWGLAVSGPHVGAKLELVRGYMVEWYEWVSSRPETGIF